MRFTTPILIITCTIAQNATAQQDRVYISRPHQVVKLVDLNGDGDYLDFAERTVFADDLPAALNRIAAHEQKLFVGVSDSAEVWLLEDRNGDGDALDFAEVSLYGQLPTADPTQLLAGLAVQTDGCIFTADFVSGEFHLLRDLNRDGDALDADETMTIAENLVAPVAVAIRPDDVVLVAQADFNVPVRILEDRNADGDFLDFAENLSYCEDVTAGDDLVVHDALSGFLIRGSAGEVIQLRDLTGDNDALDFAEVILYADGLDAPAVITTDGAGGLYVAAGDSAGTVYFLFDSNGDGDALDFGEVVTVAEGVNEPAGIAFVASAPTKCMKGDVNIDAIVDFDDVIPFVDVLLENTLPADFCSTDVNDDGAINGDDIQAFVDLVT